VAVAVVAAAPTPPTPALAHAAVAVAALVALIVPLTQAKHSAAAWQHQGLVLHLVTVPCEQLLLP
jgi:hypothetical protein